MFAKRCIQLVVVVQYFFPSVNQLTEFLGSLFIPTARFLFFLLQQLFQQSRQPACEVVRERHSILRVV